MLPKRQSFEVAEGMSIRLIPTVAFTLLQLIKPLREMCIKLRRWNYIYEYIHINSTITRVLQKVLSLIGFLSFIPGIF